MPFGIEVDFQQCTVEIAKFMAEFGTSYAKAYQVALVQKILQENLEAKKEDAPEAQYQLDQTPPTKAPEMKGEMKKKSAILGRWKAKYFYVKENYDIGYSAGPDQKEEGTINLWGYKVQSIQFKPEGPRRGGPEWIPDEERPECKSCSKKFSNIIWHHHCRNCGEVFCSDCAGNKASLNKFGYEKPQRVCDGCFATLGRDRSHTFAVEQPKEEKKDAQFFGIQLVHKTRTPYVLECPSFQEKKDWMDALIECCVKAELPVNPDPVLAAAFEEAHKTCMQSMGYWWAWRITGNEVEMLSELVSRKLDETVVSPAFENADPNIPASVKKMAISAVNTQLAKLVAAGVSPAWRAIIKKISENQNAIEEKVKPMLSPIGDARDKVVQKLQEGVVKIVTPAMEKIGSVVLDRVMEKAAAPILNLHKEMYVVVHQSISEYNDKIVDKKHVEEFFTHETNAFRGSTRRLRAIHHQVDETVKSVKEAQAGNEALQYLQVSKAFQTTMDSIHGLCFNTILTVKNDAALAEPSPDKFKQAWARARPKLLNDSKIEFANSIRSMLIESVMGPVEEHVLKSEELAAVTGPLDELIPEAVRDFISVSGAVNDVISGIVEDTVNRTLDASLPTSYQTLDDVMSRI